MWRQIIFVLLAFVTLDIRAASRPVQDNVAAALARAQGLFHDGQFQAAIDALLDLDKRIGNDPQSAADKLKVNLYLGLSYSGLNLMDQAKARFIQVCTADEKYSLNADLYSSKIITVFGQAKQACAEDRAAKAAPAADAVVRNTLREGQALYDKGRYQEALPYFGVVMSLDKTNEVAREYYKLTQQQLALATQRLYANWRENFNARKYDEAATVYFKLRSSDSESGARDIASRIEAEYEKRLGELAKAWQTACDARDQTQRISIQKEANDLAAKMPFAQNVLSQMDQCIQKKCIYGDPALALTRVRTRVNPRIEPNLQRYVTRGIRATVQIDEKGNVTVSQILNANPRIADAIKAALEQWKFNPMVVDNQARCVETDLPINLIQP
jgi:tetratricopeptide (TPR) repeat protein